jgi:hypothetical protein
MGFHLPTLLTRSKASFAVLTTQFVPSGTLGEYSPSIIPGDHTNDSEDEEVSESIAREVCLTVTKSCLSESLAFVG